MKTIRIYKAWCEDVIWKLFHPGKVRVWLYPPNLYVPGYERFFHKWHTKKWRVVRDGDYPLKYIEVHNYEFQALLKLGDVGSHDAIRSIVSILGEWYDEGKDIEYFAEA